MPATRCPRLRRRDVPPAFVLQAQFLVKERQHVVLKGALLFHIQLEQLPLLRPQAGVDEEFERAGGELLHPADRRAQDRPVEPRRQPRRKPFLAPRVLEIPQSLDHRGQRRQPAKAVISGPALGSPASPGVDSGWIPRPTPTPWP